MTKRKHILLSMIVPIYNEEKRIKRLKIIDRYLKKKTFLTELIVVNDGSTDTSLQMAKKLQKDTQFSLISYNENKGKGYAIQLGMNRAKGIIRIFTDIDLSTPIQTIDNILPIMQSKKHVVIGSRKMKGAIIKERQHFVREQMGKFFTLLSQAFVGAKISDYTCGFKCFSEDAAEVIFSKSRINRWGFDPEIIFLAKKHKILIQEIPVIWKNDNRTKVRFPQDVIVSLIDLFRIRIHDMLGFYR